MRFQNFSEETQFPKIEWALHKKFPNIIKIKCLNLQIIRLMNFAANIKYWFVEWLHLQIFRQSNMTNPVIHDPVLKMWLEVIAVESSNHIKMKTTISRAFFSPRSTTVASQWLIGNFLRTSVFHSGYSWDHFLFDLWAKYCTSQTHILSKVYWKFCIFTVGLLFKTFLQNVLYPRKCSRL